MQWNNPYIEYYTDIALAFGVRFKKGQANINTWCPFCEKKGRSKSPSCSVSSKGLYKCMSCGQAGTYINFYTAVNKQLTYEEAVDDLIEKSKPFIHTTTQSTQSTHPHLPKITNKDIRQYCDRLKREKIFYNALTKDRGLTLQTLKRYHIGCDENRITIPIYDKHNKLVALRRYLPKVMRTEQTNSTPKMIWSKRLKAINDIYPQQILERIDVDHTLCIFESELDTLLAIQNKIPAVCVLGGVGAWQERHVQQISSLKCSVAVIFNVNDKVNPQTQRQAGDYYSEKLCEMFLKFGVQARNVKLPLPTKYVGGDFTDFIVEEGHTIQEFKQIVDNDNNNDNNNDNDNDNSTPKFNYEPVSLEEASHEKYYFSSIEVRGLVAGKADTEYLCPERVTISYMVDNERYKKICVLGPHRGEILELIRCTRAGQKAALLKLNAIPAKSKPKLEIESTMNVSAIHLTPPIEDQFKANCSYIRRRCFYVGRGLKDNTTYVFQGYTLPDPKSQMATHIFEKAIPLNDNLDDFMLDVEDIQLLTCFQPAAKQNIVAKLKHIADEMSVHVTNIFERSDLHIAVDLIIHSPLTFHFNNTQDVKGWVDGLILGDSSTGKGFVATGLMQYYNVGQIVSGENISIAGLVGGVHKVDNNSWDIIWGALPLNDRRLVCIDEVSSLSKQDIGRLSRIRSEGVAEIHKIKSGSTRSRTRIIWLSNPGSKGGSIEEAVSIGSFNYGIQAVNTIVDAAEDIRRFDFVLIVKGGEVSDTVMNQARKVTTTNDYHHTLCHKLISWIWSRTADQIHFTKKAVARILQDAIFFGRTYSRKLLLIQSENVRFKLARIAAAIAARTFSTSDGINLIIKEEHAVAARCFLHAIYSKESCGYYKMSLLDKEATELRDPKFILNCIRRLSVDPLEFVEGMLCKNEINLNYLSDATRLSLQDAAVFRSDLVRNRALQQASKDVYIKTPMFRRFLVRVKRAIEKARKT